MIIGVLLFYVFSAIAVLSSVMVVTSKNPVYSVLFLILAFFNVAGLFVLLGAELLAMLLIIVYVGAVAVLFLFVVMMLNQTLSQTKKSAVKYLPIGGGVAIFLFVEIYLMLQASVEKVALLSKDSAEIAISNTRAIGNVLYTDYALLFQIAGLILLVAMIGAIVLTHRQREGVRKQNIGDQLARRREDTLEIVKVKSGRGIK